MDVHASEYGKSRCEMDQDVAMHIPDSSVAYITLTSKSEYFVIVKRAYSLTHCVPVHILEFYTH